MGGKSILVFILVKYSQFLYENIRLTSAAGTVTKGRDINTQGMFPIRGKIPNAFRTPRNAFLANAEVQGIIKIVTGQDAARFNRNFDPNKDVEWEKIIFMADADIDGYHIASLLLRFFILYMPQLIQAGKVYKAVPPLYSIPKKGGEEYFTRNIDFVKYIQKSYLTNNKVTTLNGKSQLSGKDATLFFMNNEDYIYWLERLANTYSVEPKLVEMALFHYIRGDKLSDIQKDLKKMYRFMDVKKVGNIIVYSGTIKESVFLPIHEQMLKDSAEMIKIINKNKEWYYKINGEIGTIYDIMEGFEKTQPSHLQRYKGLGEMDEDQLAESTLLPDITIPLKVDDGKRTRNVTGNRTLIRYTLEDAKEEIELIRKYESDYSQLFKFVGNVSRQDLID